MEIAGNYCFLLHNCCCVSDVLSDARGNRKSGGSNRCYIFCRPFTVEYNYLLIVAQCDFLGLSQFFLKYFHVYRFLYCLYKIKAYNYVSAQVCWKMERARPLHCIRMSNNRIKQVKSSIRSLRAQRYKGYLTVKPTKEHEPSCCSSPQSSECVLLAYGVRSLILNFDKEH